MSDVQVVTRPPVIPSKWDIIPIHGSDVASFKRCRRYWDWSSPTRSNLRRRVDINGINIPPWFGTGIHYSLEMYYDPMLQRDPVESFRTWYQLQWDGGVVTKDWLERTYDNDPKYLTSTDTYRIRGLREMLPFLEDVQEEIEKHYELGVGMMEFYKDWAERNDDFVCVAAESVYSIPLGFESVDRREDSPNYGQRLEVHARGKRDAIIYFPEQDKYGIIDHKTAARIGDEFTAKLEKDEQCSNYLWATMREAELYDLPWAGKMVDRILYTMLWKRYPQPPTITQHGWPSIAKDQGTTAELFQETVVGNPQYEAWFKSNPKAQAYYTYLCELGEDQYILREPVTRNSYEIESTGIHLQMIAQEMLGENLRIYPNPTAEFRCVQCAFRAPCIAADDGSDWVGMLADGYESNPDR